MADTHPSTTSATYCGVRCEPRRLAEVESGRVMVAMDRAEIRGISSGHSVQAQHPVRQSIVGLVWFSITYFPAKHVLYWFRHGGVLFSTEIWMVTFGGIGLYMVISALRRGYYLDVELERGKRRLAFGRDATAQGAEDFVQSVERLYGLRVERKVGGGFPLD